MNTASTPDATAVPTLAGRATDGRPAPVRGWLPAFLSLAVIWGSSFLLIKVGVRELHPLWLTFARVAAGAATLLVVLVVTRDRLPRDRRLWGHLFVVAALGVSIPFTLFGFGEQRIPSVLAGIWNATTPLVALPLAALVFRTERVTPRRAAGIALGFVGVLIVLGVWRDVDGSQVTGQLMCFGAAMCYAVAIPYQKRFVAGRVGSGVSFAATQLVLALGQLAVVAPLLAGAPPAPTDLSGEVLLSALALGVLGTGCAFVLNFRVIRLAGASTSASVTYLMPVVATAVGVLVLGERLVWHQPVGAAVVLVGVAVAQGFRLWACRFAPDGRRRRQWPPGAIGRSGPTEPRTGSGPDPARQIYHGE